MLLHLLLWLPLWFNGCEWVMKEIEGAGEDGGGNRIARGVTVAARERNEAEWDRTQWTSGLITAAKSRSTQSLYLIRFSLVDGLLSFHSYLLFIEPQTWMTHPYPSAIEDPANI
jgi:hypothetical protein